MIAGNRLLVVGAGGHGRVVLDAARQAGWDVFGILDDDAHLHGQLVDGVCVLGGVIDIASYKQGADAAIVALGNAAVREQTHGVLRAAGWPLACVVHPRTCVADSAVLGEGTVVLAGAIVNVNARVGEGGIVNCNAVIDHDVQLEAFVHVAPLAGVGARAQVGRGAVLGMGALILQDAVVPMGAQLQPGGVVQSSRKD